MEGLKNAPRNSNNGSFTKQQKTDKLAQQKRAILELVNVADAKTTQVYFFGPTFIVLLKSAWWGTVGSVLYGM